MVGEKLRGVEFVSMRRTFLRRLATTWGRRLPAMNRRSRFFHYIILCPLCSLAVAFVRSPWPLSSKRGALPREIDPPGAGMPPPCDASQPAASASGGASQPGSEAWASRGASQPASSGYILTYQSGDIHSDFTLHYSVQRFPSNINLHFSDDSGEVHGPLHFAVSK